MLESSNRGKKAQVVVAVAGSPCTLRHSGLHWLVKRPRDGTLNCFNRDPKMHPKNEFPSLFLSIQSLGLVGGSAIP